MAGGDAGEGGVGAAREAGGAAVVEARGVALLTTTPWPLHPRPSQCAAVALTAALCDLLDCHSLSLLQSRQSCPALQSVQPSIRIPSSMVLLMK